MDPLLIIMMVCGYLALFVVAWSRWGKDLVRAWRGMIDALLGRRRTAPTTADNRTSLERETADQCAHRDAPAEPIEADVDGDGEADIIGWLCSVCGAKVSPAAAVRRNRPKGLPEPREHAADTVFGLKPHGGRLGELRVMLAAKDAEIKALANTFEAIPDRGEMIVSKAEHEEFTRAVKEARDIRDAIQRAEIDVEEVRAHDGRLVRKIVTPALPSREPFEEPVDLLERIVRGVDESDVVQER